MSMCTHGVWGRGGGRGGGEEGKCRRDWSVFVRAIVPAKTKVRGVRAWGGGEIQKRLVRIMKAVVSGDRGQANVHKLMEMDTQRAGKRGGGEGGEVQKRLVRLRKKKNRSGKKTKWHVVLR